MSWALEEWKSELSSRAVQKIAEYESHVEKLKKERQQKQIQLDSLEVAFQKQNQKLEGERNENSSLKREAQNLTEACGNLEKAQRRLSHEIQVKEALVCSLEGQLLAARNQNDKQEQEIKRLVAELERSQRASTTTSEYHLLPSSTQSHPELSRAREDLKRDELQEKHSREVEERNRLVSEVKALKIQVQQLQYSSNKSHRENGPQQIRASTFSWQQDKASPHLPESPARSPSSVFPWEQPKTAPNHHPRSPQPSNNKSSHLAPDSKNDHLEEPASEQMQELRKENQVLQCTKSELEVWVQSQEKEIKNHLNKLEEAQSLLEKSRGELAVKEQALSKGKDSLERVAVQQEQTRNKCAALEQKLKQVSEELNCQRQNAESVRRGMERKAKNTEKEYQQELADQQRTFCSLEHQHKQERNQTGQEIQQLKTEHLALQAKINKMEAGKQVVDRELEEVKGKRHWAEKELAAHQKNEDDLQENLQSALKEKECISTWQEQSVQKIVHLETQLKKLEQQLALSQRSREEMKAENLALASKSIDLQLKLDLENKTRCEGTDQSVNSYELNKHGEIEGSRSDPNREHDICRSMDGKSDHPETALGIRVEDEGKISEQVAKSVNVDPGSGGEMEEGLTKDTDANLDRGISAESQCLDKATDGFPCAEGKMEARLPEVQEEVKEELDDNGAEDEAMMPREGIGRLDQPTAAGARLGELELKLKEVETENWALRSELDDAKQEFESKTREGQKAKRTAAELRRKLKQAAERRAAEAERTSEQAGQIAALETALERERALVAKAQEANQVELGGVSQPAAIAECGGGELSGGVRILQDAAAEKMRRLAQQIARLEGDKTCVEEIIEAQDGAVNEKSRALLEYFKGKNAHSLELDDIASFFPNCLHGGPREKTEHTPNEGNVSSVETAGEGETSSGQGLLPERLESEVCELDDQLRERLEELQRKCDGLTREKEKEGDAKRRAQGMFDDLQSRIHRETQQLTVALDAQSKNIEGLLQSLGEKELNIQVLNGRLQSALITLSSLSQENHRLRADSKTVAETSWASPDKGAAPGQDTGETPQGDQIEGGNSSSQSVEKLGQKPASSARGAAHEDTRRSEVETVERSEPGFHEHSLRGEMNPSQHKPSGEEKGPSVNDPATQNVPEVGEVVEKRQQPPATGNGEAIDRNNDRSIEPGGGKASSTSSAGPPQGDMEMASTLPPAAQAKRDVESRRPPRELGHEGSGSTDPAQNSQSIRSSDGLPVKVDDPAEMVLHAEATQAEPRIKACGHSPTKVLASEGKSEEGLIEEVEGWKEEEGGGVKDPTLGAVRALSGEFNSPNDKCAILTRGKEQLGSEGEGARRVADGSPRERENSETAIRSGEDLLGVSSDERKCLRQELGALREWKQEVLGDVATLEDERGNNRVELHSLQGSVRGMQNHVKTLEAERRALEDTVESLKHSEKHLYQELEQAHFEKSVLQIQVETLQKAAVELNEEKINLLSRLKQRENASEDEELSTEHLQRSGLHDKPMTDHRQGTAEVTASQMHADLMALRQAVREKSEEVDRNLLVYTDLLEKHQDPETADETRSAVAEPTRRENAAGSRGTAAGSEPGGGAVVSGQQAVGRSVERDQAETSRRPPLHGQPRGPSAGLNPAALAMKIDPAQLAERIRRSRQFRQHLSVAYDETEYVPYGLPDVVQKGFADIPSGSFCPHILRRGILNSTFCPAQPDDVNTD
ncbi:centromere protein F-like isoform X3 [Amblyraja radiata]|uniref:centromere protein F-like isoform X3 n=1 Tax=Amblyraja radiata TaxID=386614 RepID=UPI0014035D0F|nr:centromere protein F-like isoform X3 [Amblyraja radiata]